MGQRPRLFDQIKIVEALFRGDPCGRILLRVERIELDTTPAVHESRPSDVIVVGSAIFMDGVILIPHQVGPEKLGEIHPHPALLQIIATVALDELAHGLGITCFGGNGERGIPGTVHVTHSPGECPLPTRLWTPTFKAPVSGTGRILP